MALLRKLRGRARTRQRGAVLVEMALVAPILILLVMGIIDLGRVLFTKIPIQQAAQEGSIYAGHFPDDYAAIQTQVIENTDSVSLAASNVAVSCPTGANGTDIQVTVTYTVDLIAPLISNIFGGSITLTSSQTAEILGTDPCAASP